MEQDTLRPCPFCGGEAETDRTIERFEYGIGGPNSVMDYGYQAYCKKCSVGQGAVDVPPSSEEEAVKLWNRRADDADRARLVAQVEALQAELADFKQLVLSARYQIDSSEMLDEMLGDHWEEDADWGDEEAADDE